MSKVQVFSIGITLLFSAAVQAAEAPAYQPFPKGYGYLEPAEIQALKQAVQNGDNRVTREHGWRLWAGIMQPAAGLDWPVWYTWPNSTGAFAAPPAPTASATQASATPAKPRMGRLGRTTLTPVEVKNRPIYPIPQKFQRCAGSVCDGAHFAFNGDIMIATESLSREAFDFIRDPKHPLYLQQTLNNLHADKVPGLNAPASYVVTKHMYWPVKADGLTAIPVWRDDYYHPDFPGYAGYEKWRELIAVDPSGKQVGKTAAASYLYGVQKYDKSPWPTITKEAKVYGLQDFYHHQVTQADWDSFDDGDKAILNTSSLWANGREFQVGDYLITIAMHVNTKEIPSWGLQSVWWSDQPDSKPYSANRPADLKAQGPWAHYLLTEAYGIPEKGRKDYLPIATNPYIELVTHPVGTNCYNCHVRAGWPAGGNDGTSYQNKACPNLRATLNPNSSCLQPYTLTDFQWIIPDRARSN